MGSTDRDTEEKMSATLASNFSIAARHIGWGDPIGDGLFFVGIEETLHWRLQDLDKYRNQGNARSGLTYDPCDGPEDSRERTKTRIPYWSANIACRVSRSEKNASIYRHTRLWRPNSQVFNANLLPLGKLQTSAWPDGYEALFGWKQSDREQYLQAVKTQRYPALRTFWDEYRPGATIAFGKGYWNDFQEAFGLQGNGAVAGEGRLKVYARERFILAPFFGYWHMSDKLAAAIGAQLQEWAVSIA
jgi:hypothetical protein